MQVSGRLRKLTSSGKVNAIYADTFVAEFLGKNSTTQLTQMAKVAQTAVCCRLRNITLNHSNTEGVSTK